KSNIGKQFNIIRWFLQALTLFILLLVIIFIVLQFYSDPIKDITKSLSISSRTFRKSSQSAEGPCLRKKVCPTNRLSFFIQSGAANVVPPKICVNNELLSMFCVSLVLLLHLSAVKLLYRCVLTISVSLLQGFRSGSEQRWQWNKHRGGKR
ncbi:hypothetical protein XENORESO_019841, partial [Xenotaenia resolanae]